MDVDTSCLRATAKVTSHICVGQNERHTHGTSTASTAARGAHAQILVEACAWKNRHTELQTRMRLEARAPMLAEARVRNFIMRV